MPHNWICHMKQKKLEERLKRRVTLEEVHLLCEELGFTDPSMTLAYIETAPKWDLENLIDRAKRKKRKKRGEVIYEYDYAYV